MAIQPNELEHSMPFAGLPIDVAKHLYGEEPEEAFFIEFGSNKQTLLKLNFCQLACWVHGQIVDVATYFNFAEAPVHMKLAVGQQLSKEAGRVDVLDSCLHHPSSL